jgi:RNA polymerase sigma-70 factor (ECF subfamily)
MACIASNLFVPGISDFELVEATLAGDTSAFDELIRRHDRKVFRVAQCIMKNREDAEDVTQEAFLAAFQKLHQFQNKSLFSTWMVRIGVNHALMKLRSSRKVKTYSLDDDADDGNDACPREVEDRRDDPEQRCYATELEEVLAHLLQRLSPRLRTVFLLRDIEGMTMNEIAETLELTISAAKTSLFRARQQLRKDFGEHFGDSHRLLRERKTASQPTIEIGEEAYA